MKIKEIISYDFKLLIILLTLSMLSGCTFRSEKNIVIENSDFRYETDIEGKNLYFVDRSSGIDYLDAGSVSYCASIEKDGKKYSVTSVSKKGKHLKYEFGDAGVTFDIHLTKSKDRIVFKVLSVTGDAESLTFILLQEIIK